MTEPHFLTEYSISIWHPKFEQHALRTRLLQLPKEFVDYLKSDGIVMSDSIAPRQGDSDEDSWSDEGGEEEARPAFPKLEEEITAAIADLDAAWICSTGTKCSTVEEILLLLKASTRIHFDTHYWDFAPPVLALRKWYDLKPQMEYRCFAKNRVLVAFCQRSEDYYEHLQEELPAITARLAAFFTEHLLAAWAEPDFVADVYLAPQRRVYVLDFAPWSDLTDPLLFTWADLHAISARDSAAPVEGASADLPVSRLATTRPPRLPALPLELTEVGGPLDDAISHLRNLLQKEQ